MLSFQSVTCTFPQSLLSLKSLLESWKWCFCSCFGSFILRVRDLSNIFHLHSTSNSSNKTLSHCNLSLHKFIPIHEKPGESSGYFELISLLDFSVLTLCTFHVWWPSTLQLSVASQLEDLFCYCSSQSLWSSHHANCEEKKGYFLF